MAWQWKEIDAYIPNIWWIGTLSKTISRTCMLNINPKTRWRVRCCRLQRQGVQIATLLTHVLATVLQGMFSAAVSFCDFAARKHCYQRQTAYIQIRFSLMYQSVWYGGESEIDTYITKMDWYIKQNHFQNLHDEHYHKNQMTNSMLQVAKTRKTYCYLLYARFNHSFAGHVFFSFLVFWIWSQETLLSETDNIYSDMV